MFGANVNFIQILCKMQNKYFIRTSLINYETNTSGEIRQRDIDTHENKLHRTEISM